MNFDDAMRAHSDWKIKLQRYLRNPDGSINAVTLGQDNQCVLGKWLYGEGRSFSNHPEYQQLLQSHKSFHQCASDIVVRSDRGENLQDAVVLGSSSAYGKNSSTVASLIMKLKLKTQMNHSSA